ncbi:hypothetical protein J4228_03810 [Candidatus Woesearchaeota archaeon]|nr:hypothetical protein [Candidatus Woesearchaeota archaeon]
MVLTKDDKAVLKALVEQELQHVKKDKVALVNSPVLSSIMRMKETDIPFMKSKALYQEFLEHILKKL